MLFSGPKQVVEQVSRHVIEFIEVYKFQYQGFLCKIQSKAIHGEKLILEVTGTVKFGPRGGCWKLHFCEGSATSNPKTNAFKTTIVWSSTHVPKIIRTGPAYLELSLPHPLPRTPKPMDLKPSLCHPLHIHHKNRSTLARVTSGRPLVLKSQKITPELEFYLFFLFFALQRLNNLSTFIFVGTLQLVNSALCNFAPYTIFCVSKWNASFGSSYIVNRQKSQINVLQHQKTQNRISAKDTKTFMEKRS